MSPSNPTLSAPAAGFPGPRPATLSSPRKPGTALPLPRLAILGALALLSGCLSRPALVVQNYALQTPPPGEIRAKPATGALALRMIEVSPLFESKTLVYRTTDTAYEHDPYAELLVPPGRALGIPIRNWLARSGLFKDVVIPGSLTPPNLWAEIYVQELYGDFRKADKPAAVLSLSFAFYGSSEGAPPAVILQKTYSRSIPLSQNTAAAVVGGWDKALAEILGALAEDLTAATSPAKK